MYRVPYYHVNVNLNFIVSWCVMMCFLQGSGVVFFLGLSKNTLMPFLHNLNLHRYILWKIQNQNRNAIFLTPIIRIYYLDCFDNYVQEEINESKH